MDALFLWRKITSEKPTVFYLVMKCYAFYGTWSFIMMFTEAYQWSLSWATWIKSTPPHSVPSKFSLVLTPICGKVFEVVQFLPICWQKFVLIISPVCITFIIHLMFLYFIIIIIFTDTQNGCVTFCPLSIFWLINFCMVGILKML